MAASQVRFRTEEPPRLDRARWGRRLLALVALIGLGVVLMLGWRWLTAPERFPLQEVRVEGRPQKVGEAELSEALGPYLNKGMLGLDLSGIRQAVEALPWVERAGVRRRWPNTLEIDIREHEPVARWGEAALLSARGEVFAPAPASFPADLPQLSGPQDSEDEVLERFQRLGRLFAAVQLPLHLARRCRRRGGAARQQRRQRGGAFRAGVQGARGAGGHAPSAGGSAISERFRPRLG
jgi:cell division septal protein FtsQ